MDAVLDTGFTGYLLLPPDLVTALGLPFRNANKARLADGSIVEMQLYEGTVLWDGRERAALVYAAEGDSLIGMSLLYGNNVSLDVVDGGPVRISTLTT